MIITFKTLDEQTITTNSSVLLWTNKEKTRFNIDISSAPIESNGWDISEQEYNRIVDQLLRGEIF